MENSILWLTNRGLQVASCSDQLRVCCNYEVPCDLDWNSHTEMYSFPQLLCNLARQRVVLVMWNLNPYSMFDSFVVIHSITLIMQSLSFFFLIWYPHLFWVSLHAASLKTWGNFVALISLFTVWRSCYKHAEPETHLTWTGTFMQWSSWPMLIIVEHMEESKYLQKALMFVWDNDFVRQCLSFW